MSKDNSYNTQGAESAPDPQEISNAQEASASVGGGYAERPQLNPYPGPGAVPAAQNPSDLPMKRSQGKAVFILLVCILAVNAAALVMQFANPFSIRGGNGGPGITTNGYGTPPTDGGNAPTFNEEDGAAS